MKREFVKSQNVGLLVKFMEANRLNQTQAGANLGVSGSSISNWIKDGEMPFTMELAVKYLNDKAADPDGVRHYLLTLNGEKTAIKQLDELEEMTMGGQRFKLIPI